MTENRKPARPKYIVAWKITSFLIAVLGVVTLRFVLNKFDLFNMYELIEDVVLSVILIFCFNYLKKIPYEEYYDAVEAYKLEELSKDRSSENNIKPCEPPNLALLKFRSHLINLDRFWASNISLVLAVSSIPLIVIISGIFGTPLYAPELSPKWVMHYINSEPSSMLEFSGVMLTWLFISCFMGLIGGAFISLPIFKLTSRSNFGELLQFYFLLKVPFQWKT